MALEMKFGGDQKQFIILSVLGVVLAGVIYTNYFTGPPEATLPPATKVPAVVSPKTAVAPASAAPKKKIALDRRAQEFRPRVGPVRNEDRPDPMTVDPTLRLELLARMEKVQMSGGMRSLFDFSNSPSGPLKPEPKIIPVKKVVAPKPFIGPMPPPAPAPVIVPPKPQAPPIPLKFYGFASSNRGANRRAFFLDGDEILVGGEGDLVKKRYKVIRIGLTTVTMEDTQFGQQQTLPIVPEGMGG
jgi:hypothetical protein